jgi:hypothetical protein
LKFKNTALPWLKKVQTLHDAKFETYEQLSLLAQFQITNKFHVINFGTNSNLNLPWTLKGYKTCGKNLINSLKINIVVILRNMNLVGHTCMQENEVSIQVSIWLDFEIRNEFEIEIQTTQHFYFIQALQIHGEVLLKHCSCYCDTRVSHCMSAQLHSL